jgi:hypothetical protein
VCVVRAPKAEPQAATFPPGWWNVGLIGAAIVIAISYAVVKRPKSDQSYTALGAMIVALISLFLVPPVDIARGVLLGVAAFAIVLCGIRSIQIAEGREASQRERDELHETQRHEDTQQATWLRSTVDGLQSDVKTLLVVLRPPVTGSGHGVQAPQMGLGTGRVDYVTWPERQTLREQVIDLIRNARIAAEALRISPDDQFTQVLATIAEPFVAPSIAIRQALRRILGYPNAAPLNHLPAGVQADDFDTIADVHETLLKEIPSDAPAVRLQTNDWQ